MPEAPSPAPPRVGVVVLAAGASRRLPGPKQLLTYQGETLLRRAARTAVEAGCGPVVVVLAPGAGAQLAELDGLAVCVAENREAAKGLSTSIRAGLEALEGRGRRSGEMAAAGAAAAARTGSAGAGPATEGSSLDAVLFLPCDQPLLTADMLKRLVAEFEARRPRAVSCEYAGTIGVPALFSRSLFEELRSLHGDVGAKRVLQRHASETLRVGCESAALDVDTPEDAARLL